MSALEKNRESGMEPSSGRANICTTAGTTPTHTPTNWHNRVSLKLLEEKLCFLFFLLFIMDTIAGEPH